MESLKIVEYMDRQPLLLTSDMPLSSAAEALIEHKKLGAAVVDDKQCLVGFLSQQDCLSVMIKSSYHCDLTATVKDCMQHDVLTVSPSDSILNLAEQMLDAKPKIYPVIENNSVVGVISRTNVLTALNIYMQHCYLSPV